VHGLHLLQGYGLEVGSSLVEEDKVDFARELLATGKDKIVLPRDFLISDALDVKARKLGNLREVEAAQIPAGWKGVDIGPQSIEKFRTVLQDAKTVIWNGPMGVFEIDASAKGTFAVAGIMADITGAGATTVIGGGDSAAAVEKAAWRGRCRMCPPAAGPRWNSSKARSCQGSPP